MKKETIVDIKCVKPRKLKSKWEIKSEEMEQFMSPGTFDEFDIFRKGMADEGKSFIKKRLDELMSEEIKTIKKDHPDLELGKRLHETIEKIKGQIEAELYNDILGNPIEFLVREIPGDVQLLSGDIASFFISKNMDDKIIAGYRIGQGQYLEYTEPCDTVFEALIKLKNKDLQI